MTEEFEDMIEEVEDEVVEESQSSADPINTEEVVEEDELIVTDEMLDTIADTAIAALQDILQYFNVGEVTIDEYEGDEGELILDISGKDMAVLIGCLLYTSSLPSFKNFTKSTMPPMAWKTSVRGLPSASVMRSSVRMIFKPRFRKAISRKRAARVS